MKRLGAFALLLLLPLLIPQLLRTKVVPSPTPWAAVHRFHDFFRARFDLEFLSNGIIVLVVLALFAWAAVPCICCLHEDMTTACIGFGVPISVPENCSDMMTEDNEPNTQDSSKLDCCVSNPMPRSEPNTSEPMGFSLSYATTVGLSSIGISDIPALGKKPASQFISPPKQPPRL